MIITLPRLFSWNKSVKAAACKQMFYSYFPLKVDVYLISHTFVHYDTTYHAMTLSVDIVSSSTSQYRVFSSSINQTDYKISVPN